MDPHGNRDRTKLAARCRRRCALHGIATRQHDRSDLRKSIRAKVGQVKGRLWAHLSHCVTRRQKQSIVRLSHLLRAEDAFGFGMYW